MEQHDTLIIGAGIAGLTAATQLQKAGRQVTIFERWPRLGGRMSTYPIGDEFADDGAQFFTVRHPRFQAIVDEWQAAGLIEVWGHGWSDGSKCAHGDGYPRYVVRGGMRALPEYLAQPLDVRTDMVVTAVSPVKGGWTVKTAVNGATKVATKVAANETHHARTVIMTAPVPQSLAILDAGKTVLPIPACEALQRIRYAPSLTGLFWVDGTVKFPEPGAIQRPERAIVWMADNRRKGVSKTRLITVQASPGLSNQLLEADAESALAGLEAALRPFLAETAVVRESHLKRWRYALPTVFHPDRCLRATTGETASPIIFAGDAFKEPRVEGAVLSGLTAVEAIGKQDKTKL